MSHSMQPAAQRGVLANAPSLASQQKKGGLHDIFSIFFPEQQPTAHPENHQSMAFEQGSEGRLVSTFKEPRHKSMVAGRRHRWTDDAAQLVHQVVQVGFAHHLALCQRSLPS